MCPNSLDHFHVLLIQMEYSFILPRGDLRREEVDEDSQKLPLVTFPKLWFSQKKIAASCQLKSLQLAPVFRPLLLFHLLPFSLFALSILLLLLPRQQRDAHILGRRKDALSFTVD